MKKAVNTAARAAAKAARAAKKAAKAAKPEAHTCEWQTSSRVLLGKGSTSLEGSSPLWHTSDALHRGEAVARCVEGEQRRGQWRRKRRAAQSVAVHGEVEERCEAADLVRGRSRGRGRGRARARARARVRGRGRGRGRVIALTSMRVVSP